ncbi:MAG: hypothetical protein IKG14_03105 [Clostridia bacterium]|nr:hypothetical protein [Clostridia bacterium]
MKYIRKVFIVLFGLLIIMLFKQVNAATSATVYTGEAISIEKIDSVEITSNDVNIDINTSKVENKFIIKNIKDEELVTKVTAKILKQLEKSYQ